MSSTMGAKTVEQLKHVFDYLSGCCLKTKEDGFDPTRIVAHGGDDDDGLYGPEGGGLVIFENADGRFGVLEDGEDSSGHG